MKVFDAESGWPDKVNFVDKNNVFVGYDLSQDCCEYADWFISDTECTIIPEKLEQKKVLRGFVFDTEFFKVISGDCREASDETKYSLDSGGIVIFRLVNNKGEEKFLHIFNAHNGYYSHGFEFKHNDTVIKEGYI